MGSDGGGLDGAGLRLRPGRTLQSATWRLVGLRRRSSRESRLFHDVLSLFLLAGDWKRCNRDFSSRVSLDVLSQDVGNTHRYLPFRHRLTLADYGSELRWAQRHREDRLGHRLWRDPPGWSAFDHWLVLVQRPHLHGGLESTGNKPGKGLWLQYRPHPVGFSRHGVGSSELERSRKSKKERPSCLLAGHL